MKRVTLLLVLLMVFFTIPVAKAQDSKTITVSWLQEPDSLNPMYTTMTFSAYTYQLFLTGAWTLDASLNPVPVLVEEIPSTDNGGISEDGTTFTLKLKEGMVWSDGDPLDSADFLFTYDMVLSEQNAPVSTSPWDRIASVEAPDELTVVITFDEPYAPWLGLFSYVLPEHVLRPVFEDEGTLDTAEYNLNPTVGNGAYVLETWDYGNFARFVKNENFVGGVANIDTIIVTFVPDDQTYVANLLNGSSDLGTFVAASDVPELEAAGLSVEIIPSGYNEGWYLNVDPELAHPAMQDVLVREAIALAFDRQSVVEDLLLGVLPAGASWWENTPYANPDLDPVAYDPDRARELLDEAGWVVTGDPVVEGGDGLRSKDGVDLVLRFATNTRQIRRDIQAVAQQQLGLVGIEVQLENYESNVFFNGYADGGPVATGQYDIAEWSGAPDTFPDPDTSRFTCADIPSEETLSGGNWNYYCNPELDELIAQQIVETDYEARIALWNQIDEIIYNDYVWIGVWHDADIWVVGSSLVNANINGVYPFWDVVNWDIAG